MFWPRTRSVIGHQRAKLEVKHGHTKKKGALEKGPSQELLWILPKQGDGKISISPNQRRKNEATQ